MEFFHLQVVEEAVAVFLRYITLQFAIQGLGLASPAIARSMQGNNYELVRPQISQGKQLHRLLYGALVLVAPYSFEKLHALLGTVPKRLQLLQESEVSLTKM
jgi:hypothetical protein